MDKIRTFIAVELPAELKQFLSRLQAELKSGCQMSIKWVNPDGIHLTLRFLGDVSPSMIEPITRAMTDAAQKTAPFKLNIQQLGAFPNLKRVQVVWVGLGGEMAEVEKLHRLLESNLYRLGFAAEQRSFKPHLTLARLGNEVSAGERQRLGELIADTTIKTDIGIKVDSISLIRSQLTPQGAIYSRLSSAELPKQAGPL
jgi:2'-5' RNA ligase